MFYEYTWLRCEGLRPTLVDRYLRFFSLSKWEHLIKSEIWGGGVNGRVALGFACDKFIVI